MPVTVTKIHTITAAAPGWTAVYSSGKKFQIRKDIACWALVTLLDDGVSQQEITGVVREGAVMRFCCEDNELDWYTGPSGSNDEICTEEWEEPV